MRREDRERAFWERIAPHYDHAVTGIFGKPMPRMLALTAEGAAGAENALEVAAGTGVFTAVVAPRVRHLMATDYTGAMLTLLRKRVEESGFSNVECAAADIHALPYPPASFDLVVAGNVLHLVPDLPGALAALCRVLRPGGRLLAPTYCHAETLTAAAVSRVLATVIGQPMRRRFSAQSLRAALEDAGLRVVRTETAPGLIPATYVEAVLQPS
ncbi:MAG TPA: class I SAM-dependent methyltransferase [Vicinamibacterales bacterium]|nr:class I SAM-dependent methyltransferase [Vicinamibacterales bacterium]